MVICMVYEGANNVSICWRVRKDRDSARGRAQDMKKYKNRRIQETHASVTRKIVNLLDQASIRAKIITDSVKDDDDDVPGGQDNQEKCGIPMCMARV